MIQICDHWSTQNLHSSILNIIASIVSVHGPFWAATTDPEFWVWCGCGSVFWLWFGSVSGWGLCVGFELLLVCGRREPLPFLDPEKNSIKKDDNNKIHLKQRLPRQKILVSIYFFYFYIQAFFRAFFPSDASVPQALPSPPPSLTSIWGGGGSYVRNATYSSTVHYSSVLLALGKLY